MTSAFGASGRSFPLSQDARHGRRKDRTADQGDQDHQTKENEDRLEQHLKPVPRPKRTVLQHAKGLVGQGQAQPLKKAPLAAKGDKFDLVAV